MGRFIALLLRKLQRTGQWPLPEEAELRKRILRWQALRETDRDAIARMADWPIGDRPYKVDGLPARIPKAWANYLFGEPPQFVPANVNDHDAIENLTEGLEDELHRGEDICAAEGEVWWRIHGSTMLDEHPQLQFYSRLSVVPLWQGRTVAAVAFVSQLTPPAGEGAEQGIIYRHFEIHERGLVENHLFIGTRNTIGQHVDLGRHPETETLTDSWVHGLPGNLAGRIYNELGRDPRCGVSEYAAILDQLLDLNEVATIGSENVRLTAKKRVIVPASALEPPVPDLADDLVDTGDGTLARTRRPRWDAGEDVIAADPLDGELGRDSTPFQVLEYSFDAEPLIAWKRDLVETAVSRRGITAQWLGLITGQGDGYATTGAALRYRLIPTTAAGNEKARPWDRAVPHILELMIMLDALGQDAGGFGVRWAEIARPTFTRGNPLPEDQGEEDLRHAGNVTAGIESVKQSIKERHPEWSDDQVQVELDDIRTDRQAAAPSPFG